MDTADLAAVFGVMTLINLGFYLLAVLSMFTMRAQVLKLHVGVFDIPEEKVRALWYAWLGTYKIIILAFNLTPYLAFRLLA